jgi:hypothetical protein
MTTLLSLPAIARVAERHVRQRGPATRDQLLAWTATVDVASDRAEAGLRLAVTCGRLELAVDSERGAIYRVPQPTEQAERSPRTPSATSPSSVAGTRTRAAPGSRAPPTSRTGSASATRSTSSA